jgi:hypothetical protein
MLNPREKLNSFFAKLIEEMPAANRTGSQLRDLAIERADEVLDPQTKDYLVKFGFYMLGLHLLKLQKSIVLREKTRDQLLQELNVPAEQRAVILALKMDRVRCPIIDGKHVNLYGPNRATPEQLRSAASAYSPQAERLNEKAQLLLQLADLYEDQDRRGKRKK